MAMSMFVCRSACYVFFLAYLNKSSAVAEMGDRFAIIDMGRKVGVLCPFPWRYLGPHLTQCLLG